MANGNGYTATEVIEAVKNSKGFVTTIAKALGCSRMHVYRLIEKYPTAKEALENEREGNKDFVEGKLMQQIDAGNITAIIFYLKTQGKDRGYVERQEIVGPDDGPIILKVVYGNKRNNDTTEESTSQAD